MHDAARLWSNANTRIYNVGIYVRLSREDEYKKLESESIQNQKEYCSSYVNEKGWNIVDYYCDDGYTGTNFSRPGFIRLLEDIESKRINAVVTKDLSRLGRDHVESGRYIETYFPEKGVRYIAINDSVDTFSDYDNMLNFRFAFNDQYPKDISRKVRTVMDAKRNKGDFIGAFAPYGYRKSVENKSKLEIDEETAAVVKRIFEMYVNGFGFSSIARALNRENVLSPGNYKKLHYISYYNPKTKLNLWTAQTIRSILINPTYIGNLAQGKYEKVNYKSKKLLNIPRENWIVSEDTHEPIINKGTFQMAQEMMENRRNTNYSEKTLIHLLTGIIYCGDCGERMTFTKTKKGSIYCICSKYKRFSLCSRHAILEKDLERYVIEGLKAISSSLSNEDKLLKIVANKLQFKNDNIERQISEATYKLHRIKENIKVLYADRLKGVVSEEDFIDLSKEINSNRELLIKELEDLIVRKNKLKESSSGKENISKLVEDFRNFKDIDRFTLIKLIDKIKVFEDKRIVIYYRFKKGI